MVTPNQTAIITGSSRGIGAATFRRMDLMSSSNTLAGPAGALPQESGARHGLQGASSSYRDDVQFVRTRIAAARTKKRRGFKKLRFFTPHKRQTGRQSAHNPSKFKRRTIYIK